MSEESKQKTTATKSTEAAKKVRGIVKNLNLRAQEARHKGLKTAYCMVGCNYDEILWAMDIVPIWTENFAGLCAAKRVAQPMLVKAESEGYSNVICGYARTGIGYDAYKKELGAPPEMAPDGGMAEPDLLLGCSATCDPRFKWYQALGRYRDSPVYSFDIITPPIEANLKEVKDYYCRYQKEQFQGLITFLEGQTGKKMSYERLLEGLVRAEKTRRLWWDSYELRKTIPCPMSAPDHFNVFVPGYFLVCEDEGYNFYQELSRELKDKTEKGLGAIPEEKYRLMWGGGLPPWHSMNIFDYFASQGAVFVRETSYRPPDPFVIEGDDPLQIMAERAFYRFTCRYERALKGPGDAQVQLLLDFIEQYKVDGIVMHATRSCRATTIGQMHFRNLMKNYVKAPTLFMESDLIDMRDYSEAQTQHNIEAFMELVASQKVRQ